MAQHDAAEGVRAHQLPSYGHLPRPRPDPFPLWGNRLAKAPYMLIYLPVGSIDLPVGNHRTGTMEAAPASGQPQPLQPRRPRNTTKHVRTRLLNAAVRVFDRKGYAAASVREVAEMAGVTKPAVYYHFGSKEGLLVAILQQAEARGRADARPGGVARPGTARDRILALCEDVYAPVRPARAHLRALPTPCSSVPPDGAPPFDVTVFEARVPPGASSSIVDRRRRRRAKSARRRRRETSALGRDGHPRRLQRAAAAPGVRTGRPRGSVAGWSTLLFDGVANAPRIREKTAP
ncbi:MAG: TetR/AcrR family transcriptional regulator [Marinilabiliales bacterium]|nr:TetR/AcrR family transcriptional regulator [Marinilabiliales bacterium]